MKNISLSLIIPIFEINLKNKTMFIIVNLDPETTMYINVNHIISFFKTGDGTTINIASTPGTTTIYCIDDCDSILDRTDMCKK